MNHIEVVRQLWEAQEREIPECCTPSQVTALQILFRNHTQKREERLKWVSDLFGYSITTFSNLTKTQAFVLLDYAYPDSGLGYLPESEQFVHLIDQLKTEEAPIEEIAF